MQSIVTTGMKIDLHIHSCASVKKDGKKVKNNTKDQVHILVEKLNYQDVNICAITDHDVFSYEIYSELKKSENENGSIKKVLPGIEFSVLFQNENDEEKVIHIISIFDDKDSLKVSKIEKILNDNRPDKNGAYTESNFLEILRKIDIDTILIAHQKGSLLSKDTKNNDANSLGNNRFLEFVYSDYFEAFEFKNKRNEILNKSFLVSNKLRERIRFVTGTDCHDWRYYPQIDNLDKSCDFPYTYAKCLPTFKGLVMALTDFRRLSPVNSFFNVDKFTLPYIELSCNGRTTQIPLSKGINVIIGDNSIGKSMLLHAITGYDKEGQKLDASIKRGYKKYLESEKLNIAKQLNSCDVFHFDMQGEVRKKFEENSLKTSDFLKRNFPRNIDSKPYKSIVEHEIERMMEYLSDKFALDSEIQKLHTFSIVEEQSQPESMIFQKNLRIKKKKTDPVEDIVSKIDQLLINISQILSKDIDDQDKQYFSSIQKEIITIILKYKTKINAINEENDYIETIAMVIDNVSKKHNQTISAEQKRQNSFSDNSGLLKDSIIEIIKKSQKLKTFSPNIDTVEIVPNSNKIHSYEFISKLHIDRIDNDYFYSCIDYALKSHREIDFETITEPVLKSILLKYDESTPVLHFFKELLLEKLNADLQPKQTIISEGMDKYEELSAGMDAKIYFDLLSFETTRNGIYIIDQPEDNVSQIAIKSYLLEYFKSMAENRQIIMVTHNPQFIVNLDVDNLIFISKKDGQIHIQSGALEYECEGYKVLEIVEKNIDGGLDSIQKRWKRYEKVNHI